MEFHAHTVPGHQGERLYTAWYPGMRGTLFWVHGYAEHSGRYEEVTRFLLEKGWGSLLWDLRGHGRSTGSRGFITDLEEYLYDLTAVWTHWKEKIAHPVVLAGHSLGGLIVLRYLQKYPEIVKLRATIISAPLLQLKLEVPGWKKALGQVAARLFPSLSLPSGLLPEQLTHDPEEARAYAEDPHIFRTATAGWFAAIQRAQIEVWRDLPLLTWGTYLFLLPEADPICDTSTAKKFYDQLPAPEKKLILYPDSYHEPLHETFKASVFQDIAEFLSGL
uniref:Lysophospholipase n=1 Tax=uncultured Bacteroidota bacterium TaxID=152509 RepID=H5SNU6_9BACT|nr:lysophospholipase [uncultured Bacteroidetes bacterium]